MAFMTVSACWRAFFLLGSVFVFSFAPFGVIGPPPFQGCATKTGSNASLILPSDLRITINGVQENGPVVLAVFTPEGHCVGTVRWSGKATTLTAWGTDTVGQPIPSPDTVLTPGDSMYIRLFTPDSETEYNSNDSRVSFSFRSDRPHLTTHRRYVPDGIYVLNQIRVYKTLVTRQK